MNKISRQQLIEHLQNMINLLKQNRTNQGVVNYIKGKGQSEFKVSLYYNNSNKDCVYIGEDEK